MWEIGATAGGVPYSHEPDRADNHWRTILAFRMYFSETHMPRLFVALSRLLALVTLLTIACNLTAPAPTATPFPTASPTRTPQPTAMPSPTPLPTATLEPTTPAATPDQGALHIPAGPVLGSPEAAQAAFSAGTPFLESIAVEQYAPAELSHAGETYTYTVNLAEDQPLIWINGWCAADEARLRDNDQHLAFAFSVNGTPIDLKQFALFDAPNGEHYCRLYYTVVSGWPKGTTELAIQVTFDAPINDGINAADFPQGVHEYKYIVRLS